MRPIGDADDLARLVGAAYDEGPGPYLFVLIGLDAGLRLGEILGLRWGHVVWGVDEDDTRRSLCIVESRPRGGEPGLPKSGRTRSVALSRRLRRALLDVCRQRFGPPAESWILEGVDPSNFHKRASRRVVRRADLGPVRPKDLRDTFASQLLTAGVQLGYVSNQLGHADVAVTARHYARWCGDDAYREPMTLHHGEVPADFLARLPRESPHQSPHLVEDGGEKAAQVPDFVGGPSWIRTRGEGKEE